MKEHRLSFRRGDFLAVALVLLAVTVSAFLLPGLLQTGSFAEVYQDGVLIRRVPLDVNQTFLLTGDYTNTVTVRDGKIAVTHSDCPTKDCVHQGWKTSGSIICLPNRVEIRLKTHSDVDIQSR